MPRAGGARRELPRFAIAAGPPPSSSNRRLYARSRDGISAKQTFRCRAAAITPGGIILPMANRAWIFESVGTTGSRLHGRDVRTACAHDAHGFASAQTAWLLLTSAPSGGARISGKATTWVPDCRDSGRGHPATAASLLFARTALSDLGVSTRRRRARAGRRWSVRLAWPTLVQSPCDFRWKRVGFAVDCTALCAQDSALSMARAEGRAAGAVARLGFVLLTSQDAPSADWFIAFCAELPLFVAGHALVSRNELSNSLAVSP